QNAQVEVPDDRAPGEIDAERLTSVPPRAWFDVLGVDIDGDGPLVVLALPVVAVVGDARIVTAIDRCDPHRAQHLVQRASVADLGVVAPRAWTGVLGGERFPDVPALLAYPPQLPRRTRKPADVQAGDLVPVTADVEVVPRC